MPAAASLLPRGLLALATLAALATSMSSGEGVFCHAALAPPVAVGAAQRQNPERRRCFFVTDKAADSALVGTPHSHGGLLCRWRRVLSILICCPVQLTAAPPPPVPPGQSPACCRPARRPAMQRADQLVALALRGFARFWS